VLVALSPGDRAATLERLRERGRSLSPDTVRTILEIGAKKQANR
jgi:hypothetical protein